MSGELWREFMPNYEASDLGRIRRATDGRRTHAGRVMRAQLLPTGYYQVRPTMCGKNVTVYVHDAVAAAFLGPKPDGAQVNHKDGDKTNNAAANLEYVTRAGNMRHAAEAGLMVRGESHPQAKLTDDAVRALRADRASGLSFSRLSQKYGISIATAFHAAKGNNWRHIE